MKHERTLAQRSMPAFAAASVAVLLAALAVPHPVHAQTDALVLEANGNVGIGVANPTRQLHLQGNNATFRMDRDANSAAFILTRTAPGNFNTVWKTFVVGVDAGAPNSGEFVINDLGTATGGTGNRRMTITNAGNVIFTGSVSQASSARYKEDIATLDSAALSLQQLRGVRFVRKETGEPALGLVAEEVLAVYPELVELRDGAAESVNYAALVAVLIEGFKEQQESIRAQELELSAYRAELSAQRAHSKSLEQRLDEFEALQTRVSRIEGLLTGAAAHRAGWR